jgi:hypothetical protein
VARPGRQAERRKPAHLPGGVSSVHHRGVGVVIVAN